MLLAESLFVLIIGSTLRYMATRGELHRSEKGKILGGVCSGLGEYFDVDPVIFRILFVVLLFADGVGALAYILLWIILPSRGDDEKIREIN